MTTVEELYIHTLGWVLLAPFNFSDFSGLVSIHQIKYCTKIYLVNKQPISHAYKLIIVPFFIT